MRAPTSEETKAKMKQAWADRRAKKAAAASVETATAVMDEATGEAPIDEGYLPTEEEMRSEIRDEVKAEMEALAEQAGMGTVDLTKLTLSDIQSLIVAAVNASKALDPEEQEKKDEDRARKARAREQLHAVLLAEQQSKIDAQANCNHKKDAGRSERWSIGGQLHSDGFVHEICTNCQKEIRVYKPRQDQLMSA